MILRNARATLVAVALLTVAGCGGSDRSNDGQAHDSGTPAAGSSAPSTSGTASTSGSLAPSLGAPDGLAWTSPSKPTLTEAFKTPRQPNAVFALAISHDGTLVASGDGDGTVKLWHDDGSAVATLKGHRDEVNGLAFSPDGKSLASVGTDGTLRLWDVATRKAKVVKITAAGPMNDVESVAWSPDGSTVVTGGWGDSGVRVLAADGTPKATLALDPSLTSVDSVAFSPDGSTLVVGDMDRGVLEFWQTSDWTMRSQVDDDYSGGHLTYSPDGTRIYGIGNSEDVDAWDAASGAPLQKLDHGDDADDVALSPDGALVASVYGIWDGTLHLSSVADGSLLAHDKQDALGTDLAFSPTQPLLVAAYGPEIIGYHVG